MQCHQPPFCTNFQNNPQYQYSSYYIQSHYPDVIGEGDVLSYILPDGRVQCYFVPVVRRERWIPPPNSCYMPNNLPSWSNNNEAWFVRSIFNPYSAAVPNQLTNNYGDAFLKATVNSSSHSFVQKFHYDSCTSTTDLRYFYPRFCYDWSKGCAGVQVQIPIAEKSIFHCGAVCNQSCCCNPKRGILKTDSNCMDSDCTETPMYVDENKSTHSCCDDLRKKGKSRSKNKSHTCACPNSRLETADKVVTTYADQAISCTDLKGFTQSSKRRNMETEIWHPRRKCKKDKAKCSSHAVECECVFCVGSACSDTDQCDT